MRKPKCYICGRIINAGEHYFLIRRWTVCKECEEKMRPELSTRERARVIAEDR